MSKEIYSQIFKQIKSSNNILLATHENPDGDALASMCAMYEFLHSLNKDVFLFAMISQSGVLIFYHTLSMFKDKVRIFILII